MFTQNNLIIIAIVRSTKPKYICIYIYIYTPLVLPLLVDSRFQKENFPPTYTS
jgi:hypothetical protein